MVGKCRVQQKMNFWKKTKREEHRLLLLISVACVLYILILFPPHPVLCSQVPARFFAAVDTLHRERLCSSCHVWKAACREFVTERLA